MSDKLATDKTHPISWIPCLPNDTPPGGLPGRDLT